MLVESTRLSFWRKLAFAAAFGVLCLAMATQAAAQIKLVSSQPIVVRSGAGVARIKIANFGTTVQPLQLSVGIFVDETSRTRVEQPKASFVIEGGGDLPASLAAGQSLDLAVDLSGMSGALSEDAPLFNGGTLLGTIRAAAVDTPLNVALDGRGSADQPLDFTFAHSAVIPLKNGGKDYLSLDWRFLVGGTLEGKGVVVLPPGAQARVVLAPSAEIYSPIDFFRPASQSGVLLLRPHTFSGVDPSLFDLHPISVSLRMNRLGYETTETLFALYVMFFLLLGGVLSLLANSILPNMLKRIGFEKQLARLADRTSSVSYRVDSYVRVLLRLERKKIEFALKEATWYSLSIAEKIDSVAVDVARLDKRLTLAERVDELRRRFEDMSTTAPPFATDVVDQVLQSATEQLHSFTLPEEVLTQANNLLGKASAEMDALADDAEQAKRVAANFKEFKTRLDVFPKDLYPDLEASLSGVFRFFTYSFDNPANLVTPMLFAIDHAIAAGHIILDYAMVRACIAKQGTVECPNAGKEMCQRLRARECRLIELLGTLSWKALREARILIQEMREDVYEEDIIQGIWKREVDRKQVARIVFDTQRARPYLPIYFSVDFDNPRFKNAAALKCLSFRWHFPGNLTEEGSKVCHYFVGTESEIVLGWDCDVPEDEPARESGGKHDTAHHHVQHHPAELQQPAVDPSEEHHVPHHRASHNNQHEWWFLRRWRRWSEKRLRRKHGFTTKITVIVQKPNDISLSAKIHEKIKLDPRKRAGKSRVWVEIVRFLLAFGVALVGIEAGAIDQLRKLDFLAGTIAVIALGFGADSIKNLLTQGPKKTA